MRRTVAALIVVAGVAAGAARAGETFVLLPPAGDFRAPASPLELRLRAGLPAGLAGLFVELDGIDVTRASAWSDGVLRHVPVEPLAPGPHRLRVLGQWPDGRLEELARFDFEVRRSAAFRDLAGALTAEVQASRGAASRDAAEGPDASLQGSLELSGRLDGGTWRAESSARAVLDTTEAQTATGRPFELGSWRLAVQRRPFTFDAGHFAPLRDGLLVSRFRSRGLALGLPEGDGRDIGLTLFAMRPDETVGFARPLGVEDPDRRTFGGELRLAPLDGPSGRLVLRATAYAGRGAPAGTGAAGGPETGEASGVALAAEAELLGGRLVLGGAVARSWWDADGRGPLADREPDHAFRLTLGLRRESDRNPAADGATQWSLQARYAWAGPLFRSLLGTGVQPGQRGLALAFEVRRKRVSGRVEVERTVDDAGAGRRVSTTRLDRLAARAGYAFAEPLFGTFERADLALTVARRRPGHTVPGSSAADDVAVDTELKLPWSLGESRGRLELGAGLRDDRRSGADTVEGRLSFELSRDVFDGRMSLSPGLTLALARDRGSGAETVDQEATLDVGIEPLWGDSHALELSLAASRSRADSGPDERLTLESEATLRLDLLEPRGPRPGLSLELAGGYTVERDGVAGTTDRSWRVHVTLTSRLDWRS